MTRAPGALGGLLSLLDYRKLAFIGVAIMLASSLYINLGSVRESTTAYTGSLILPPGGAASVTARIDGENGRILVIYSGNEAPVAVRVQGPQGVVADRIVSGNATVDLQGLPASTYRVIFYNPGAGGSAEAGVLVIAAYDAPVYTSTAACKYLLATMIGAIIAGYSVAMIRAGAGHRRGMRVGLETPGAPGGESG